jgi:iron complex transport system ATP-binding protein
MTHLLEVNGLTAGYGNGPVIADISFTLERGEFVTVLGRNGSGKSTLIKALQRLVPDVSGEVLIAGESVAALGPRPLARRVAYVPQIYDPVFEFRVSEVILMGRYARQGRLAGVSAADSAILEEVLGWTRTAHLADKQVARLSGGERQRVFIARALAQDAPLLLLDEPSAHLDISYQVEIYDILRRLQREKGKTILAAEHNINLAVPYSQRILFLKEGRVAAQGAPAGLVTRESIRDIFDADVLVRENPASGFPEISLITGPGKGGA